MMQNELLLNWLDKSDLKNVVTQKKSEKVTQVNVSGTTYFLKKKKSVQEIEREVYLHRTFGQQMNIAVPLITKKNTYAAVMEGTLYSLYECLEGVVLWECESEKKADLYGEAIARLHVGLSQCSAADLNVHDMNLTKQLVEWAIPSSLTLDSKIQEVEAFLEAEFLPSIESLPKQIIHRDPNPSNVLLSTDEQRFGFIDFDLMCVGVRIFDLGYCSTALLMGNFQEKEKWFDSFFNVIKGYNRIVPLTAQEKEAIFSILLCIQFIFIAYFLREKQQQLAMANMDGLFFLFHNRKRIKEGLEIHP